MCSLSQVGSPSGIARNMTYTTRECASLSSHPPTGSVNNGPPPGDDFVGTKRQVPRLDASVADERDSWYLNLRNLSSRCPMVVK
jgi:hypothetical protein